MKLRQWQSECIESALEKFSINKRHYLVLATPGAGKTHMASSLAKNMLEQGLIDLVICFSPSSVVCNDFTKTLEDVIGEKFDGKMGAKGCSLTYQSMQYLDEELWYLFEQHKILVIFDEIHHCAGSNIGNSNSWGEQIILNIQGKASYTLALTGTPWRSDTAPIVLSNYCDYTNKIQCDFIYGLSDAIRDGVCRLPQIVAIDNNDITVKKDKEHKSYSSFKDLLSHSSFPYQQVIQNKLLLTHILEQANEKLDELRKVNPDAGGLVVASTVDHVMQIAELMRAHLNEDVSIITYQEDDPTGLIRSYRNSDSKWVISIGMISEGTNIPRLQVICHLTRIKTEMYFRQINGRNLRITGHHNQDAYLFMPAEPKLLEYAYRIADDIPEKADVVKFEKMNKSMLIDHQATEAEQFEEEKKPDLRVELSDFIESVSINKTPLTEDNDTLPNSLIASPTPKHTLSTNYEKTLSIFGRFRQEVLELGL
ncbi:DEAD/DEAH box helicase [Parashewanella tropica]|uniref:DEAD/DEAH box helicase n=1 Tax=Parashewanella tropica TaxID=2547970 RepID=UPI0010595276|nr:DEAD/DEAH box helicase family protein [Parashewanella tropica]